MRLVQEFADDSVAITKLSMIQESNGHIPATTADFKSQRDAKNASNLTSTLLNARWWPTFVLTLFFFWMNIFVVPVACLCTLYFFLYPIKLISVPFFNRLEHGLCSLVNDEWISASKYCGLKVVECGDDIKSVADGRTLCLINHCGLIDHFCLMTSFHDKNCLTGRYLWVIFNIWKWNPVGAMWIAHGNFFVQGSGIGEEKRAQLLERFKCHLQQNYWKYDYGWIIMYPEGSRFFLVEEAEKRYCNKRGIQPFCHCTHPRIGAAHAVLEICGSKPQSERVVKKDTVEYIVDCTLGYHKGIVPHFGRCLFGLWPSEESKRVFVHYKIHKVNPEWCINAELFKKWLYEQYKQKDQILDHFYKTGKFLSNPDDNSSTPLKERSINISNFRCLLVNFIWLILFYLHVNILFRPCLRIFKQILANI